MCNWGNILKGEIKGGHLNDFDELRLKSILFIYFHPTVWFDQVALYRQWIEYVGRHHKGIAPQGAYFEKKLTSQRNLKF